VCSYWSTPFHSCFRHVSVGVDKFETCSVDRRPVVVEKTRYVLYTWGLFLVAFQLTALIDYMVHNGLTKHVMLSVSLVRQILINTVWRGIDVRSPPPH
jgi:hypothetical protein